MGICPRCGKDNATLVLGPGQEYPHDCDEAMAIAELRKRAEAAERKWGSPEEEESEQPEDK